MVERSLDLVSLLARKSHFLLGPRQTGKSTLLRQAFPDARVYDLLDSETYLTLSRHPGRIAEELVAGDRIVAIDEIQRLPGLLNEVHRLIESRGIRFLLTGSSGRKLRRGGENLLGGRARIKHLHPLTAGELGSHFDLDRAIRRGTLPSIYFSDDPRADLRAYAGAYLQEEIVAEGVTRNVPAFSRFLKVAALCNGTVVNFTNAASDAQVPRTTIYEYFSILRDTLLLHELPAWRASPKRRPIVSSKYYWFDIGVVGGLLGRGFRPGTPEFGSALETYLMHELTSWRDYISDQNLSFWRSASGYEVDFIIEDHTAIELKAKANVSGGELRSLRAIAEERTFRRLLCVCLEPQTRRVGEITLLPFRTFLSGLWSGAFGN